MPGSRLRTQLWEYEQLSNSDISVWIMHAEDSSGAEHARRSAGSLVEEVVAQDGPPAPVPGPRVQLDAALPHVQRAAYMVVSASAVIVISNIACTPKVIRVDVAEELSCLKS